MRVDWTGLGMDWIGADMVYVKVGVGWVEIGCLDPRHRQFSPRDFTK